MKEHLLKLCLNKPWDNFLFHENNLIIKRSESSNYTLAIVFFTYMVF